MKIKCFGYSYMIHAWCDVNPLLREWLRFVHILTYLLGIHVARWQAYSVLELNGQTVAQCSRERMFGQSQLDLHTN